jgi:circadian clock protein KaiC
MALQFMMEGAKHDERGLMLTLDEPANQVLRNASSLGFNLEAQVNRGMIDVWYEPPQEIEIDRHFHDIEKKIHQFQPKRVVIDSLSTYGSSLGAQGRLFRDFFHALVALMKEHQIAAVYNHENP